MDKERVPTIRDLYPDLNDAELAEAEDNLDRYIALVAGIVERLEREGHLTPGTGTLPCTPPRSGGEAKSPPCRDI